VVSIGRSLDLQMQTENASQLLESSAEELSNEDFVVLQERRKDDLQQISKAPTKPTVPTKTLPEILQHTDVAMNTSETTVPKAEVVTAFNSQLKNSFLVTRRGTAEETNTNVSYLELLLQKAQDYSDNSFVIL
jgi:hypothetical protein